MMSNSLNTLIFSLIIILIASPVMTTTIYQSRMLQDVPLTTSESTSSSYILKFFFSLMFILVTIASLAAIANMKNSKDTLLYAKFIADVGR